MKVKRTINQGNKKKLEEIAITTVNAECSAIIMNKGPEKLEDPGKFLIPCALQELNRTSALANSRASINLLPHSIYKQLGLEALTPTRMTLRAVPKHSISHPMGIAEDVVVRVDGFTFLADFVMVNFQPDPRVPIILGRPFLRTAKALIDLYEEKLTLRVGKDELLKTSDNFEKFTDELAPLDSLPMEVSSNFKEGYFDSEGDVTFLDNCACDDTNHNLASEVISNHEPDQNESSITFSPRSDPLHHEFAGEVITLPSRNDHEFEEYLSLMTVLCEISTSQSQGNVHANQSSVIESLPVSPIPVEENEVNELPNLDHQDDPSVPRPPPEPPDVEKCLEPKAGILITKVFKERISKKRTKNEAKKTKPDTEWKSVKKTKSRQSPSVKKSIKVIPDKSKVKK
ncbi:reverse transcriptase domain-containing protein [Tanacetum coccineum]